MRKLDRELQAMEREEQKAVAELKKAAKAGEKVAVKTLAKSGCGFAQGSRTARWGPSHECF